MASEYNRNNLWYYPNDIFSKMEEQVWNFRILVALTPYKKFRYNEDAENELRERETKF